MNKELEERIVNILIGIQKRIQVNIIIRHTDYGITLIQIRFNNLNFSVCANLYHNEINDTTIEDNIYRIIKLCEYELLQSKFYRKH